MAKNLIQNFSQLEFINYDWSEKYILYNIQEKLLTHKIYTTVHDEKSTVYGAISTRSFFILAISPLSDISRIDKGGSLFPLYCGIRWVY